MSVSLDVDAEALRARFQKLIQTLVRVGNHQMRVEMQVAVGAQRFEKERAETEIGHEMAVHRVEMEPLDARVLQLRDLLARARPVGGQKRRREPYVGGRSRGKIVHRSVLKGRDLRPLPIGTIVDWKRTFVPLVSN